MRTRLDVFLKLFSFALLPHRVLVSLTTAVFVLSAARAQSPVDPAALQGPQSSRTVLRDALPSEKLGPDDLLDLSVSYCPELTRSFRVAPDGTLNLPLLHEKVMAAGHTPAEVAEQLKQAIEREKILVQPIVDVSVLEYRSRSVNVIGAVNHPLTFQATGNTTLLDAITLAGGLSPDAGGTVYLARKATAANPHPAEQAFSVRELISGKTAGAENPVLQGGENIRVPEASKIFVVGDVRRPGMYPMQRDDETTIIKALSLSEGLSSFSAHTAFIYRRVATGQARQEIPLRLDRILAHKAPDMELLPDDILYVPTSNGKRMTSKVLSQIVGFGQTAGTGMLIYR